MKKDQQQVPQLLQDLGLTQGNIVKTPRVKLSAIEGDAIENSPILEGVSKQRCFGVEPCVCAYLAQDRVDISETIKCLARVMSKPRTGHMMQLKRVARCLKGGAKEGAAEPRTGAEQSTLGSARGQ